MEGIEIVRWQFGLAWSLAEVRLAGLSDAECAWEPAPGAWTVRAGADGVWRPDWVEPEPEPPPATTIGWLSWHLTWWWTTLLAHTGGEPAPAREDVAWPGDAERTVAGLTDLRERWTAVLGTADPDRPIGWPWPRPRPFAIAAAWANQELMKNVAEIGQLRDLYGALNPAPGR
ncbi:MAG TPA: DinB family protein [Mycobacteriales bacterium]|nr:DinB family protein [Mycobacteriales bacterium]